MQACEVGLPVITLPVEITDTCTLCTLLPCITASSTRDGKDKAARNAHTFALFRGTTTISKQFDMCNIFISAIILFRIKLSSFKRQEWQGYSKHIC